MTNSRDDISVTLLTGFLGAGKTTLLNHLLNQGELKNAALIINEFGDVGIDHLLVESSDEGVVEMSDGCLCCTIRGDLIDTLTRLVHRSINTSKIERIVIETTGLADPAPILHAVMGHPALNQVLRLDGVLTVIDGINGQSTLDRHFEAVKQAAVADRVILTKTDLMPSVDQLRDRIRQINPTAVILDGQVDKLGPISLFGCGLYNPSTKSLDVQHWLNDAAVEDHHDHHHDVNRHDKRIRAFTLKSDLAIDSIALTSFIDLLRSAHGPNLLRVKGIINVKDDPGKPVVIHGVQEIFHPPATLPHWPDDDRQTRLVMITQDLSENFVERLFRAFLGQPSTDTPDRMALENNPLAIPGVSPSSQ